MVIRSLSRSVFAIRVYAGGLDVVSGEPAAEDTDSDFRIMGSDVHRVWKSFP